MLSVSLDPEDWASIARCAGPTWVLEKEDAQFLDVFALQDDHMDIIESWGIEEGLAERKTIWRAWSFDDEADDWRYMRFLDEEKARCEAEETEDIGYDSADIPSETGTAVDAIETVVLTETGMSALERWSDPAEGQDGLIILWAREQARLGVLPISGIWWDEDHHPEALSCPRGGVFQEALSGFRIESTCGLAPPDAFMDSLQADEMPAP